MYKLGLAVATLALLLANNCCLSNTEIKYVRVCPFVNETRIQCDRLLFQTISVTSATYGRTTCDCGASDGNCGDCQTVDETERIRNKCEGRRFCNVKPRNPNNVFTGSSSCTGNVSTFLDVSYTCNNLRGYMGCFDTEEAQKLISEVRGFSDSRTIQDCLSLCREGNFIWAGLARGAVCGCGKKIAPVLSVSTSECNVHCTEDASQRCGGSNHVDIYRTTVGQCGGRMEGRTEGVVYSPGFPGDYPDNENCSWIVSVHTNKVIQVLFLLFDLRNSTDFLFLKDGSNQTARLLTAPLTGKKLPPRINATSSNAIWINFQSTGHSRGFILKYKAIDHCGKINVTGRVEVSPDHNGNFGIGETARIDCKNASLSLVVECMEIGQFNVTPPYCNDTTPSSTVRSTATPSVQTSSSQLAATSTATTRDGSQEITIATAGQGNNSIFIPTSPSTEADGTTDVPSTSVTEAGRESTSSQLAATSMTSARDGSQGTTIAIATAGQGNNSIFIPASPSTEADGKTTDVPSTSVTEAGRERKAPPGGRTLPVAIGAAVGVNVLVLTAIIVTVVIVMKRRRTPTSVPPGTSPPKATTDVTTDVTTDPEPTYDTIREEEEGGVELALSGATCSYSAIGQPNVTSGPDRQVPVYSKPDKNKAKTPQNVEDLYAKPNKKESGEVENVLYESAGDLGASSSQDGADNVLYASADEI